MVDNKFRLNIEASENKRLNKISLSTRNFRLKIKSCLDFRFNLNITTLALLRPEQNPGDLGERGQSTEESPRWVAT